MRRLNEVLNLLEMLGSLSLLVGFSNWFFFVGECGKIADWGRDCIVNEVRDTKEGP